ncbi:unnamed protein product, partial [Mesorhabditis belari]|uniref:SF-assemblin n=1 Tax=Mesorhabditis belari TaxID=2138241 RepID=A0AAF3FPT9_9BILA
MALQKLSNGQLTEQSIQSLCHLLAEELSLAENISRKETDFQKFQEVHFEPKQRIKNLRKKIHSLAAESRDVTKGMIMTRRNQNQMIAQNRNMSFESSENLTSLYAMMSRKIRDEVFKQLKENESQNFYEDLDNFYAEELQWRNEQNREMIGEFREREAQAKASLFEANVELSNQQLVVDDLNFRMKNDEKVKNRLREEIGNLRGNLRDLLKEKAEFEEDKRNIEIIKGQFRLQKEINEMIWAEFLRLEEERDFLHDSLTKSLEKMQEMNLEKIENFDETLRKVELDFG